MSSDPQPRPLEDADPADLLEQARDLQEDGPHDAEPALRWEADVADAAEQAHDLGWPDAEDEHA